jgi:hypothetical protein
MPLEQIHIRKHEWVHLESWLVIHSSNHNRRMNPLPHGRIVLFFLSTINVRAHHDSTKRGLLPFHLGSILVFSFNLMVQEAQP